MDSFSTGIMLFAAKSEEQNNVPLWYPLLTIFLHNDQFHQPPPYSSILPNVGLAGQR